ncbi:MAG TPA: hypothetical protein VG276_06530 [Actinomycetes bacterium]|nr:hypothetical protein [Actinomycetes bacterium]
MSADHPSSLSRRGEGGLDLWARTLAAGDHPTTPNGDQADAGELVAVVRLCTCTGGPRPRARLAATCRALLGWTPPYRFDPACLAHATAGDVPAWQRSRPEVVFTRPLPRLDAWRYAPALRRGHHRPLTWLTHRHRPAGRVLLALPWCAPEWFTRCWCGALSVERGWHQPHPWPARSPTWRARMASPPAAELVQEEAPDA